MRQLHGTKILLLLTLFGFCWLVLGSSALAEDLVFGPETAAISELRLGRTSIMRQIGIQLPPSHDVMS
jgi:hypothetical protein